jgi:exopolyphosphatase / guanosine-5'-triphosphate,3'-diphosphate pyrophosphatase
MTAAPLGIIDIGSNSVRLVVYAGAPRIPAVIFNEKVMAGLGRGLSNGGEIDAEARDRALSALERFLLLARQMEVSRLRVVATAAVRDASNGIEFLADVQALGLQPDVLAGEEEAKMAAMGVLSCIPEADGIAGDLGGGSLELVEVCGGEARKGVSLPLGVLRLEKSAAKGATSLGKKVRKQLEGLPLLDRSRGRPFYLVGGSWRALARLDMLLTDYPLPITHHYRMQPDRPQELEKAIAALTKADVRRVPTLSVSRIPTLPYANMLLRELVQHLQPSELVVSSYGIREGLIYSDLPEQMRKLDPLLEAVRQAGRGLSRFKQHGDLLDRWIAPLFADDDPESARLRLAACLLADVAWQAHPEFRAERGLDMALHGNWVGIDGPGRVMIAQALFCNFGGGRDFTELEVARLCSREQLERACRWGLAMRLGQRLSGGLAAGLELSRLAVEDGVVRLEIGRQEEALYGEAVERRLRTLASSIGKTGEVAFV